MRCSGKKNVFDAIPGAESIFWAYFKTIQKTEQSQPEECCTIFITSLHIFVCRKLNNLFTSQMNHSGSFLASWID